MMVALFTSLRSRLLLLVLFAGLPSLALILHNEREQRHQVAAVVQENALRLARLTAVEEDQLVTSTRQLLTTLTYVPAVQHRDSVECNALFSKLAAQYPVYANIGAIAPDGIVFGSAVELTNMVNVSDRSYFRHALETRDFAIGQYQVGRVTGKASINFAYPVLDERSNITAVVFAAVDLDWLNQLAAGASLPTGAVLTAIDSNGTVLVNFPNPGTWVGANVKAAPITQMILAKQEGTAEVAGLDGVMRLYAFTPLTKQRQVYVSVGIPCATAYSEVKHLHTRNLITLVVIAALVVIATWIGGNVFIVHRVRQLLAATHRIEGGDFTTRTGWTSQEGELGQLGCAFDSMASALQQREQVLRGLNEQLEQRVADRTRDLSEKNRELESDLALAREMQLAFLPQKYPSFPRNAGAEGSALRFTHRYLPTGAIGGDFFDVLPLSNTEAGVFICDVMGHGVRAALVTAMIRGLVEELSPVAGEPGMFLTEMNRALLATLRHVESTMFASAYYLVADVGRGELCYATAGHPWPLHVRRATGTVEPLREENIKPGPVLGLFEDSEYHVGRCTIAANDLIVLFTDGLYEVYGSDEKQFSENAVAEAVRRRLNLPCPRLFDELLAEVQQYAGTHAFLDDVCLVGMEVVRIVAKVPDNRTSARLS